MNNPWSQVANAYSQDLNQGIAINQQGLNQAAQLGNSIYDRFISGYMQQKQMRMKEQEAQSDFAFKNAQIIHMGAQNQKLEEETQKERKAALAAEAASKWYTTSLKPDGTLDTGKFSLGMASEGHGQFAAPFMEKFLKNKKEEAEIIGKRLTDRQTAGTQVAQVGMTGLTPDGSPTEALKAIRGMRDGNPDLFGHIQIPDGIDMMPPETQKAYLFNLVRSFTPVDKQIPKTELKDIGGSMTAFNIDPLTGTVNTGQKLGYSPQSSVGKVQADINAGAIDPATGQKMITKETTVQPNMAAVLLGDRGPAGYDGSTALPPGEEATARNVAKGLEEAPAYNVRTPQAERIRARAAFLNSGDLPARTDVADTKAGRLAFGPQGPLGKTLASIDTATGHLTRLDQLATAMHNGDNRMLNQIRNWYKTEFGGSADVTNFETVKSVAIPEVLKVAKGAGVINEAEEKRLNEIAKSAANPAALRGFVEEYQGIMGSRVNALQPQYQRYFPGKSLMERLTPETASMFTKKGYGKVISENAAKLTDKAKTVSFRNKTTKKVYDFPIGSAQAKQAAKDSNMEKI